jgi:polyhydroxyalkanoate synthesis regulator protein
MNKIFLNFIFFGLVVAAVDLRSFDDEEDDDYTITSLANQLDRIKFELNEIIESRAIETDHFKARIESLEDKLSQTKAILKNAAKVFEPVEVAHMKAKEEKIEKSYKQKILDLFAK